MRARFANLSRTQNVGDCASQPLLYFEELFPGYTSCDLRDTLPGERLVVGGGGLLYADVHPRLMQLAPSIAWGIGSNDLGVFAPSWPDYLQGWPLVGIRDAGSPHMWVPCASCMHLAFDAHAADAPQHACVCYHHPHHAWPVPTAMPKRANAGAAQDVEDVIAFLASGAAVITTSYHGVYWSLLLGRDVTMVGSPYSRFYGVPVSFTALPDRVEVRYTPRVGFLQECRTATRAFAQRVRTVLSAWEALPDAN